MRLRRTFPVIAFFLAFSTHAQTLRQDARLDTPVSINGAITCNSGTQVVGIGQDGALYVWTLPSATARKIALEEGPAHSVDCDAKGNLAVGLGGGKVRILDAHNGAIRQRIETKEHVHGVYFSPDGVLLALAVGESPTQLWDARSGQKLATGVTNLGGTATAAFSPASDMLISADKDTRIRAYNRAGKLLYTADAGLLESFAVAFTPDGKRFAVAGAEGSVSLFETASGKKLRTSASTGNPIFALSVLPENGHIAAIEADDFTLDPKALGLWDAQSTEVRHGAADVKGAVGLGSDKTHALLLKQEDPKTLTVSSLQ